MKKKINKQKGLERTPIGTGVSLRRRRGFTLIETLVYAFVLGVVIMVVVAFILSMLSTIKNFQISRNINQGALVSVERIIQETRSADSLDLDSSTFSSDSSDVYIVDGNSSPVVKRFFVEDGVLKLSETPGETVSLLPAGVLVNKFWVEQLQAVSSEGIKVELEIYDIRNPSNIKSFYNSVILRGSYAVE